MCPLTAKHCVCYEQLLVLQTFLSYHAQENNLVVNKINTSSKGITIILETAFYDSLATDSNTFRETTS